MGVNPGQSFLKLHMTELTIYHVVWPKGILLSSQSVTAKEDLIKDSTLQFGTPMLIMGYLKAMSDRKMGHLGKS